MKRCISKNERKKTFVDGTNIGKMKTNLAGKISISIEIEPEKKTDIQIVKY